MWKNVLGAALSLLIVSGCTGKVEPERGDLPTVEIRDPAGNLVSREPLRNDASATTETNTATVFGERYDPTAEQEIATDALKAWRTAVAHKDKKGLPPQEWQSLRAADEKAAMEQLEDLEKRHPTSSTVRFMMGQVKDHFGKHEEAAEHFRASMQNNVFNGMYQFRLAEAELKAGQYDKAIADYRQILEKRRGFTPAQVGLAEALLKKNPRDPEASRLLKEVLKADPANQKAKELLNPKDDAKAGS